MTLDELKERLNQVEMSLTQTRANFNALEGSKQELLFWIDKIQKVESITNDVAKS